MFGEECRQIEIQDFPKICRTCLVHGDVKPLIDSKIAVTLKNVSDITLEDNDKLPQNLCNNCIKRLQDIFSFSENCKVSNVYLKSLLIEQEKKCFSDNASLDTFGHDVVDGASSSVREIKTPDSKAEYKESDCNEIRKSKRNLKKQHRKEKIRIKEEKPKRKRINEYSCDTCGKKFARQDGLKRHSKTHLGIKPFECGMCGKTFVEKATLNRHYLTHTGEKPFECNLCGKTTLRKDQIISHVTKHHPKAVDYDFVITEHKRDEAEIKELLKKVDVEQKSDVSDNAEGKMNTEQDPDSDIKEDSNEEVRQFKTRKRIEICLCNLCGKVFRRRGYLKNHMAIHAKVKPFQCKICGKGFTQRHTLTRHNLVHTKERPFQCNLCGKTFTRKETLMEHLKNHEEGSKPYLCYHCGKCFSNKDYLSKHLKYYMPGIGKRKATDRKCECPHCGKLLHSISYLKTHLLTHTGEKPYECKICGNRFTVQRSLNHHLNIHKGIKPYQCIQCEKAFRTSSSLRKHTLLHTGERPFKCSSCEKGFIRRSHLKRHLRTH